MTQVLTSHKQNYTYSAMAVSPEHAEDNVFASTGDKASNFRKMSAGSNASIRTRAYRGLQYTGRKTKRGLEWLFGIEPAEGDTNRFKWEARQRRLRKLRTNKQPIPRSPPISPTVKLVPEDQRGAAKRTGRDPDKVIVVPMDPKPHVWTLAWNGVKHVFHQVWEGTPPPGAHIQPTTKERFYDFESDSEEEDIDGDVTDGDLDTIKLTEHDFFGMDSMDYHDIGGKDEVDGVPSRRPPQYVHPPSHIARQQPIKEKVHVPSSAHRRRNEFHGLGLAGKLLCFKFRPVSDNALDRLDKLYQHRPFFTYWVTFVQILVMIVVSAVYGFAPYGWDYKTETALIQRTNLGIEPITRTITTNIWGGPSQEDLVLLGARYAPCMRRDERLFDLIEEDRVTESGSGCCIRNDDSGCVQVNLEEDCPEVFAEFRQNDSRASNVEPPQPSGVVCGQSPRTCLSPRSQPPHQWSNDITLWPICEESAAPSNRSFDDHLTCDITGRPCCIGILAKCVIATLDFCNYMNGIFHEEATLCSQVNCLDDVCGLISFVREDEPDQFYRIWLSLFLHAGWIHLFFTCIFHVIVLRDVEKHIGWFRVGIIYLGSGFAGNIFSGTFIPYFPAVGPAGSLMGIISTLLVYVILEWKRFINPLYEICKLLVLILFALIIGLLPYVDNFAHIGGLVTGVLLSAIFVPYYPPYEGEEYKIPQSHRDKFRRIKILLVAICLPTFITIYVIIFVLFYEVQPNCSGCTYITCIPFTDTICQDQQPTPENRDRNL